MSGMRRRDLVALLGGTAAAWPLATPAQQGAMPVVGFVRLTTPEDSVHLVAASFRSASILQAPMECAQAVGECFRRRAVEEAHGRHCRLLRARCQRPRGRRAASRRLIRSPHRHVRGPTAKC
jgi:hypothetical protein